MLLIVVLRTMTHNREGLPLLCDGYILGTAFCMVRDLRALARYCSI